MSSKNDFIEQQQDSINEEWNCYCNEINSIRHKYGLDSKVFTPNDKERFVNAYKKKSFSLVSYNAKRTWTSTHSILVVHSINPSQT